LAFSKSWKASRTKSSSSFIASSVKGRW
jgi:hypothetical protein